MRVNWALRYTAFFLVFLMFTQSLASQAKPLDLVAIREKVADIGEGHQCRLKLVDGTQAKGTIVSIHADNLTLKTKDVDQPRRIDYAQVAKVHKAGRAGDAKVAITVGAVAAGVLVGLFIWFVHAWTHSSDDMRW
jgi:hypothetical protein